jgi:hypothetical protein
MPASNWAFFEASATLDLNIYAVILCSPATYVPIKARMVTGRFCGAVTGQVSGQLLHKKVAGA